MKYLLSLMAVLILPTSPLGAEELLVGKGRPFATIGEAMEKAGNGDRIRVGPGVYRERLIVRKSLVLLGEGFPLIDGGAKGSVVTIHSPATILSGFRIENSGNDLAESDAGVYLSSSARKSEIRENRIEKCAFGIWVGGARGSQIIGNRIKGRKELISQKRGNGIHLWNVKEGLVEGNHIEESRDGIMISVTRKSVIRRNRISNLRYGIHYMYSDRNRVEENITHHNRAGLAVMFSQKLVIGRNRSYDNEEYGILFRDLRSSQVTDNVFARNGKGLFLYNSLFNGISDNLIVANKIGTHVWAGSEKNGVEGNTFIRNETQVYYVGMKDEIWTGKKKGNYWSDYRGWDMDGDGLGDLAYEPNGVMERMVWSYPLLKFLLNSPASQVLRLVEKQFPLLKAAGIVDRAPLMKPPHKDWKDWIDEKSHRS